MATAWAITGAAIKLQIEKKQRVASKQSQELQEQEQALYGCSLYGVYSYPFNQMSQDWSEKQVEGFYYHEISDECSKRSVGQMPVIVQVYTYILCQQHNIDYETVFALIEAESDCSWSIKGADGGVGYLQVHPKRHSAYLELYGDISDDILRDPFNNIRLGIEVLATIKQELQAEKPDCTIADVLEVYDSKLNTEQVLQRARQLKEETQAARSARKGAGNGRH